MLKPETKARKLLFYEIQLKNLQYKAHKSPKDKKIRGAIGRLMDKIDKIKGN